jgi:plasmid rolling circle replication initiator protein Rep
MNETKKPDLLSIVVEAGEGHQAHNKKLVTYAAAKRHQERVSAHILAQHPDLCKEYDALQGCGSQLVFHYFPHAEKYRLRSGFTCKKHLLCCCCAIRRSAVAVKTYEARLLGLLAAVPTLVPVLITKTVKNGPDLAERFAHLTGCHQSMVHRRRNALTSKSSRVDTILRHVVGAAGSYECKRGRNSGQWHPHMHEIALIDSRQFEFTPEVEVKRYWSEKKNGWVQKTNTIHVPLEFREALRAEWNAITGDSHQVDVRRIDPNNDDDFFGAICEAFKYSLKFNELELEDQVEAYRTLKGKRMMYSYGSFWGLKLPDESADQIEDDLALQPYVELVYRYYSSSYNLHDVHFLEEEIQYPAVPVKTAEQRRLAKRVARLRAAARKQAREAEAEQLRAFLAPPKEPERPARPSPVRTQLQLWSPAHRRPD